MKTVVKIFAVFCGAVQFSVLSVLGQGAFQNLNFETENIPAGTQPGAAITIPGWTASTPVYYDDSSLGGALISIADANIPGFSFTPLQGSFSAILFAGPDVGAAGASAISQTGLVPVNAKSILMDIASVGANSASTPFTVTLGGQQIAMAPYQTFANYTVYAGDISAEAGQPDDALTITQFPPAAPTVPPSSMVLDDIIFSPNAVPEPATWTLLLFGAGLLGVMRQCRKP